jgi:hypothetical protein
LPDEQLESQTVARPVMVEKVPALQARHALWPSELWYWPLVQASHSLASALTTNLPAAHEVQVDTSAAPTAVEYLPLPQLSHSLEALEGSYLPVGQSVQVPEEVAPVVGENLEAGQASHQEDPVEDS